VQVHEGSSRAENARDAVQEATASWPVDVKVDMIFAFHSTKQDAGAVAAELAARFPGAHVAGCTTAGEHLSGRHLNGALVLAGLSSPRSRWAVTVVDIANVPFDAARAEETRDTLLRALGRSPEDLDPQKHACIVFMDGLSMKEEGVSSAMAEALIGVPLVGGSAGDDLKFVRTQVIADDRAYDGAAVFVLVESEEGLRLLKHQHFVTTQHRLAVTKVDLAKRKVIELDGRPAAESLARALGIPTDTLTTDAAFAHPLTFECDGELYMRSVQRIDADGSIAFYCAIEEGMVLGVGGHLDIAQALATQLEPPPPRARFLLACNCILRAIEADRSGTHDALGGLLGGIGEHVLGFDTYGEQLNGLHINQTIVGLAIGVGR